MQKVIVSITQNLYDALKKMSFEALSNYAEKESESAGFPSKEYGCFCATVEETDDGYVLSWHRLDEGHGITHRKRLEKEEKAEKALLYV